MKPTEVAMRVSEVLYGARIETVASIVDKETKLPELIKALRQIRDAEFKGWSTRATDPGDGCVEGYINRLRNYAREALKQIEE
jgi:hypothetical protein